MKFRLLHGDLVKLDNKILLFLTRITLWVVDSFVDDYLRYPGVIGLPRNEWMISLLPRGNHFCF